MSCKECGKHVYTEESGNYDALQMIRDILDMTEDDILECFGGGFETGWDVIAEGNPDFISSSYDAWLKKKKAQKASDENEEAVEKLLAAFDNTISKYIRSFIEALGLNKYGLQNISINYSSDSGNLSISVKGIKPREDE